MVRRSVSICEALCRGWIEGQGARGARWWWDSRLNHERRERSIVVPTEIGRLLPRVARHDRKREEPNTDRRLSDRKVHATKLTVSCGRARWEGRGKSRRAQSSTTRVEDRTHEKGVLSSQEGESGRGERSGEVGRAEESWVCEGGELDGVVGGGTTRQRRQAASRASARQSCPQLQQPIPSTFRLPILPLLLRDPSRPRQDVIVSHYSRPAAGTLRGLSLLSRPRLLARGLGRLISDLVLWCSQIGDRPAYGALIVVEHVIGHTAKTLQ